MNPNDLDGVVGRLTRMPLRANMPCCPTQKTNDFTIDAAQLGTVVCCMKETDIAVTIPSDENLPEAVDPIEIHLYNHGAGGLTLAPEAGVEIDDPYKIVSPHFIRLKKRAPNDWHVMESQATDIEKEIMLGPVHFQSSRDASFFKYSYRTSNAGELECMNDEDEAVTSFVLPRGYKATKVLVLGSSTESWKVKRSDPVADTFDKETTGGIVGTEKDITEIPYLAGTVCILRVNMTAGDLLRGAKITLAPITA